MVERETKAISVNSVFFLFLIREKEKKNFFSRECDYSGVKGSESVFSIVL